MGSFQDIFGGAAISPAYPAYRAFNLTTSTTLVWPRFNATGANVVASIMQVNCTVASTPVLMPDATLASPGAPAMFINVGTETFNVQDAGGNLITAVPATEAVYVFLIDNSSTNGTWGAVQFAVGSAAVTAAALAGAGLQAISGLLTTAWPNTSSSTTPLTISTTTHRSMLIQWTGGVGTWDLPAAASNSQFYFGIRNDGSGVVTIDCNGADLIDGAATKDVNAGESFIIICTGSGWLTLGNELTFTATRVAIDVSGSGVYTVPVAEQGYLIYEFQGTLTGNRTIRFPASVNQFYWYNNTSGSYTLQVDTVALGLAATITQGDNVVGYSDGTNMYAIIENSIDLTGYLALIGIRTDVSSGTVAMTANLRYRATGACTLTQPTYAANQFNIVEFGQSTGTSVTVGRNSQTIDGNAADDTCTTYGYVVKYVCQTVGGTVSKLIELLPQS